MKMETYNYIRLTLVLSLFSQLSLGDLESYSDYPSHNVSLARRGTTGQRRIFDQSLADAIATVSLNLRASMPLPDFNSRITISAPFYFDFPPVAPAERASADYFGLGDFATGRSLSGGETTRIKMYKELETYVSRIMGADGHSCLLRAMCETGANPLHDDGILGDAMNFLMTGSYSAADSLGSEKSYFEAQTAGQLSGDCSAYRDKCPVSFFKYLG